MLSNNVSQVKFSGFQNSGLQSLSPSRRPAQVSFGCAADAGIPEMTAFLTISAILRRVSPEKAIRFNNYVSNFNIGKFRVGEKLARFERWGSQDYKVCFKDIKSFIKRKSPS